MNFADNLKKIRKEKGLSQEQLAEMLGISRQAVSKWEGGQSYPEMDKVVQICHLFDVNMDELINDDINKVRKKKDEGEATNKYIKSFFDYVTKVVDMFSSMKCKQIIACLFEQCLIAFILCMVFLIIGYMGKELIINIFMVFPAPVYSIIFSIIETIYIFGAFIISLILILHIFKVRYLDYYEIVRENEDNDEELLVEDDSVDSSGSSNGDVTKEKKQNKIYLEKKREKIVIRDEKHTQFTFFNWLGKLMIGFLKVIAAMLLVVIAGLLVLVVMGFVLSFAIVKSGLFFGGFVSLLIGGIIFLVVGFEVIYNFIVNRQSSKGRILIVVIGSLTICGLGLGIMTLSIKDFEIVEEKLEPVGEVCFVDMEDNLVIIPLIFEFDDIEYMEKDINNIEVDVKYSKMLKKSIHTKEEDKYKVFEIYFYDDGVQSLDILKEGLEKFNNKKLINYVNENKVVVYANKKNIEVLKQNSKEYEKYLDDYGLLNRRLEKVYEQEEINSRNNEILMECLGEYNVRIVKDREGRIIDIYRGNVDEEE